MSFTAQELTEAFMEIIGEDSFYDEASRIVRPRSRGQNLFIGTNVFGRLAWKLYGITPPEEKRDYDLLARAPSKKEVTTPPGYVQRLTDYGNPYFVRNSDGLKVDLNFLTAFGDLWLGDFPPTIKSFFDTSPLNYQALAFKINQFNPLRGEIIGDVGIEALNTRRIKVHYEKTARRYAERKKRTIEEIIEEKQRLFFGPR